MASRAFVQVPVLRGNASSLWRTSFLGASAVNTPRRHRSGPAPVSAVLAAPEPRTKKDTRPLDNEPPSPDPTDVDAAPVVKFADSSGVGGDDTGLPLVYDDAIIGSYWRERQSAATRRLAEVTGYFTPWILRVALDATRGTLKANAGPRAAELREILTALGPTFVKLGQALSVRPDIVGPNAMNELRNLCDAVPSFDNATAFAMMEEELGRPVGDMFTDISPEPIAAASLGQVYKARLRATGEEVAIKIQRPDMLRKVSLDLYCMKKVAKFAEGVQAQFTANKTDYTSLLGEWAKGTYKELDYENEAENSRRFSRMVQARIDDIYVPAVYDEYTSRKVLTMEWVDGSKLADCTPTQVNELVGKGVECFLFQLLSAGFFHADPHVGNLMRAEKDGRPVLIVIDFGLMAEIEKTEMDAMVSAIVHLANRDWPKVVEDFVTLKFLPPDIEMSQVEPVIGAILDQALEGGGAKSINFQSLSDELASVTFDFPFSIPPSFALLLRALSVLEGIALVGDPEFKLIMESFPFVSRLVMTDRSPALRDALRQILYKDGAFSVTRLRVLLDSSQGFINDGDAFVDFDSLASDSGVTKEAIDFLFGDEGVLIREILAEEIAKGIDVLAREAYARVAASFELAMPSPVRAFMGAIPGPRPIARLFPFAMGPEFYALPPVTDAERTHLENVRELADWLFETNGGQKFNSQAFLELMPLILRKSDKFTREISGKLGEKFIQRLFQAFFRQDGEVVNGRARL